MMQGRFSALQCRASTPPYGYLHQSTNLNYNFPPTLNSQIKKIPHMPSLRKTTHFFRTLSALKSPRPFNQQLRKMASAAMSKRLEGKTIVITGASSGIGRSTAVEFARTSPKNLRLILTARRIDTLKEVAKQIEKEVGSGVKVLPFKLDVSNPEEVRGFVGNLPEEWREIDVLVNNA
jgi:3-hydroxy acid dehydrogenase/malonic semialdehyde reductase